MLEIIAIVFFTMILPTYLIVRIYELEKKLVTLEEKVYNVKPRHIKTIRGYKKDSA